MSSEKSTEMLDPKAIGGRLRAERERLGLTQKEIATQLGLKSDVAVVAYEAGRVPRAELLMRYASIFRRSADWLLGVDVLATAESVVQESSTPYVEPKRRRLIGDVKDFVLSADDDLIELLLRTIRALRELSRQRKDRI